MRPTRRARRASRPDLPRDPRRARLGAAVPRTAVGRGARKARVALAARDAPCRAVRIRQREAGRTAARCGRTTYRTRAPANASASASRGARLGAGRQPLLDPGRTDVAPRRSLAGSLPPACAMSARPPPLPPTCCATWLTSSPAFSVAGQFAGHPGHQGNLAVGHRAQHDRCRLQLVLQSVHRLAQRLGVGTVEGRREHPLPPSPRPPAH